MRAFHVKHKSEYRVPIVICICGSVAIIKRHFQLKADEDDDNSICMWRNTTNKPAAITTTLQRHLQEQQHKNLATMKMNITIIMAASGRRNMLVNFLHFVVILSCIILLSTVSVTATPEIPSKGKFAFFVYFERMLFMWGLCDKMFLKVNSVDPSKRADFWMTFCERLNFSCEPRGIFVTIFWRSFYGLFDCCGIFISWRGETSISLSQTT